MSWSCGWTNRTAKHSSISLVVRVVAGEKENVWSLVIPTILGFFKGFSLSLQTNAVTIPSIKVQVVILSLYAVDVITERCLPLYLSRRFGPHIICVPFFKPSSRIFSALFSSPALFNFTLTSPIFSQPHATTWSSSIPFSTSSSRLHFALTLTCLLFSSHLHVFFLLFSHLHSTSSLDFFLNLTVTTWFSPSRFRLPDPNLHKFASLPLSPSRLQFSSNSRCNYILIHFIITLTLTSPLVPTRFGSSLSFILAFNFLQPLTLQRFPHPQAVTLRVLGGEVSHHEAELLNSEQGRGKFYNKKVWS